MTVFVPFLGTGKPADAASSMPASSSDSSNSYNDDDARRFFREWRAAEDRYSEAIRKNGQFEIHLGVFQAALNAAEEEASAVQGRLAESDATVAGKMSSMNASILVSTIFILIVFLFSMIASPDGAVGVSPTGSDHGRGCRQCSGLPHQCSPA